MKIDLVTTQPSAACSMFYSDSLRLLPEVTLYDFNVSDYDVVLVMTYDHHMVRKIRELNPRAKVGIVDPRNKSVLESAKLCDFLVVDSIEMEDYWTVAKKPIFRYAEYPSIPTIKKTHTDKEVLKIGYHGNLIHLDCMSETITPALENLSKNHQIELVVMHSGNSPAGNESWVPRGVKIKHVSWSMNAYMSHLAECDIGLVPNNILHDETEKSSKALNKNYNYSPDDYSLRFKMPSNPGRFIVFGKLGIPVVADFYPSALQYIREDLKTGLVACNSSGWENCIEKLLTSTRLRQELGDGLQSLVEKEFNFDKQNLKLLEFLKTL
jgi:hypothetical protein